MARMSSADGRLDFFADVERLSRRAAVRYHPLWYTKNKIMSGYVIQKTADLSENPYDDRRGHTDLAILGAAGRQLVEMEAQGKHALLVIPVHIDTLCNHRFHNLYEMFFQTLGSTLQRFIVLQLIGIKERKLKAPEWLAVKMFAQRCRSMIIDTGLSKIVPAEFTHVKFSVFGFNLKLLPQPEDQVFVHIDKYASYYQKAGKDTYLFGVNSRSLLTAALGAGFTYIAGEAVAAPVREPEHASFLKYEDLYKGILQ
ncbi:MAG: hypothetical protein H6867_09395 [Rhodospirillales bacterium]|nr:hypothetical protein [Rhodospirillales bacterium]